MIKKILIFSSLILFALFFGRCGDSKPSFTGEKDKYDNPTGTLSGSNASSVADEFYEAQTEQDYYAPTSFTAYLKKTQRRAQEEYEKCQNCGCGYTEDDSDDHSEPNGTGTDVHYSDASASIDCTYGGTFTAEGSATSDDATITYQFDNCSFYSGVTIDGEGYFLYEESGSTTFIYYFSGTVTIDGASETIEFGFMFECASTTSLDCDYWFLVQTESGDYYVVSGTYDGSDGTFTIKDSETTWTCTVLSESGACTNSDSTETIEW